MVRRDPLTARLGRLAGFAAVFGAEDFVVGELVAPGVGGMPYARHHPAVDRFVALAYEDGWVRADVDWGAWSATAEAIALRDDPAALAAATPDQLAKLITVLVRQERFSEGALLAAFEAGLVLGIVRRAGDLAPGSDGGRSASEVVGRAPSPRGAPRRARRGSEDGTARGPTGAPPPDAFEFFIGGYAGTSHRVVWADGELRYERFGYGFEPEALDSETLEPGEAFARPEPDWAAFRAAVDRLDVWSWAASYEPEDPILDGTQWSLELRWGDRAVASGGSNAYPGAGATVSGSNTFRAFLRAVRRLTGVDAIG